MGLRAYSGRRPVRLPLKLTQVIVTSDLLAERRHLATISRRFSNKVTVTLLALEH